MKACRVVILLAMILGLFGMVACGGGGSEDLVRPQLSHSELVLSVGETASISVSGASAVTATPSDGRIISVSVSGTGISVVALAPGAATVKVDAAGNWLQCRVTVVADDSPYSYDAELADATSRYESSSLSLVYDDDTPGIIFSMDDAGNLEILSLDTGADVRFLPGGEYGQGILENAILTVNGNAVELSEARVERCDASGLWLNLTVAGSGEHVVLVVTGL